MRYYKYVLNGKILCISNSQCQYENAEEIEITEQEYNEYLETRNALIEEQMELTEWFDGYYTIHEQKYRRLIALSKLDDDGENVNNKLKNLYNEAEEKRERLQEIQNLLNS